LSRDFVPHPHQKQALAHIYQKRRCALWMPMGGGKTSTTLTALETLDAVEATYPALVLAPLRVARSTWPEEVEKWSHLKHRKVSVITGTEQQRLRALMDTSADIYATNYEQLAWLVKTLGDEWPFRTIIADEFTRLKSFRLRQGGSRAQALSKRAFVSSRFIGLTGTPAPNGLKDLWGQIWFLDKGERLGKSFSAFEMRWFRKGHDGFSLQPLDHAQREIEEKLQDICLTVTGLQVDEPIVQPVYVDLIPRDRQLYTAMEKEAFAVIADEGVEAVNAAVRLNKCLQIANGALYLDDGRWEKIHDAKLDALESIIEEANGASVLVAYNFKSDLERLRLRFPYGRVLDADPDTIRQWNAGRIRLLFAHPASAGHGLNLAEGGNILAFFGVNWNLEEHQQIIERIGPQRQKQAGLDRPTFIYPILARKTVDELVIRRLESKRSVQDILIEAMKERRQ